MNNDYMNQEDREDVAAKMFSTLPAEYTRDSSRRLTSARGLVQAMQANGVLPQNMSEARFSLVAEWIAAGMKASADDYVTKLFAAGFIQNTFSENMDDLLRSDEAGR